VSDRYQLVATLAMLALAAGVSAQRAVFRAEARLVVLHATVTNGRGELVTNLDRDAFTVYENGKRQPISFFRRDDIPVSLGLLIDNSASMGPLRAKVEAAALAFLRASNPLDEVFVVNFADKARIDVPLTSDMQALEAGIARADSIGGTGLRDAVVLADQYLRQHASRDRRVLLVITDGHDNASSSSMEQLRRTSWENETAVFAVGLFKAGDTAASRGRRELQELTESTGGALSCPTTLEQIDAVVLDLARVIRTQYTIGYTPLDPTPDGRYRAIRVKALGAGLSVRTRAGYWAVRASSRQR
jgi:Ca-activated chloride channel homolog